MLEKNLLIRASAGTGKTFSLATRVLRLMLFDCVPVSRIVALTFSRAAAQEIYTKILSRLWSAAQNGQTAAREKANLLKDLPQELIPAIEARVGDWSAARFRQLLREVLDAQYLGNIATLDSFILRIVKNFPLELGVQRAVEVMDEISAREALDESIRRVLSRPDRSELLPTLFLATQGGAYSRRTRYKIEYMLEREKWRDFLLAQRGQSLELDGDKIRAALGVKPGTALDAKIDKAVARLALFAVFETEYRKSTRHAGRLTFGDFTAYASDKEGAERGLAKTNLEFRFDSILDHWALDEFQDTSLEQWRCLENLVGEAGGNEGTVMVVGDLKQSIYGWRGGNDEPFLQLMRGNLFRDELGRQTSSRNSHRYGTNIANFINRVFGPENIARIADLSRADCASAIARWNDPNCWMDHEAKDDDTGLDLDGDYVRVEQADDPMAALCDRAERVWAAHQAADSTETVGILVRTNEKGKAVAQELRKRGLPVVWEGMNPISDLPVVRAVLQLLKLADHPEDVFAWETVHTLLPVAKILFPGLDDAAQVSQAVGEKLSHWGMARVLQEFCTVLGRPEHALDRLSLRKLRALVKAAVDCEAMAGAGFSVDNFLARAEKLCEREIASSPKVIRILTIHRSKGLTFDRVLVPIFESGKESLDSLDNFAIVADPSGRWVLPHVTAEEAALSSTLQARIDQLRNDRLSEQIRTWYVALTRARKAMWVIVPQEEDGFRFRDLVLGAVGAGFESGVEPEFESRPSVAAPKAAAWARIEGQDRVRRIIPSAVHGIQSVSGQRFSAASLLAEDAGASAGRGIEMHEKYAQIEWATPEELDRMPESFRPAFVPPAPDATCWREMPYELYERGEWESGQIDRVVFWGSGDGRRAIVYDFKLTRRPDEVYAGQLAAYRRAVAKLAGIPVERIEARLLREPTC